MNEVRDCVTIEVIRVVHVRGKGTPEDVVREVTSYWSLDGEKLAEVDPWLEEGEVA